MNATADQTAAQLDMARERLHRVAEFALTLPEEQRDTLRLILGPEFDQPAPGTVRPHGAHPNSVWCPTHEVWTIQCAGCRNDQRDAEEAERHARAMSNLPD
jgi:hypothetical protein